MLKDGELIILEGLEGKTRADVLTNSQAFLKPYLSSLEFFWSLAFVLTLLFLLVKFIILPIVRKSNV